MGNKFDFDDQSKIAIDQFIETVKDFDNEEEATRYALMMISMASKFIQGTKGSKFKKQYLKTAINDHSAIIFAGFTSAKTKHSDSEIIA